MIIPIRCFSCGKVLADKWEKYEQLCREVAKKEDGGSKNGDGEGGDRGKILDGLGITRICCRTVMLTHVDMSLII